MQKTRYNTDKQAYFSIVILDAEVAIVEVGRGHPEDNHVDEWERTLADIVNQWNVCLVLHIRL